MYRPQCPCLDFHTDYTIGQFNGGKITIVDFKLSCILFANKDHRFFVITLYSL